jgi:hypothetical protein
MTSACGTMINGSKQRVGISSDPLGASVSVDGKPYGKTPVLVNLTRKRNHQVTVELDGYQAFEADIKKNKVPSAFWNGLYSPYPHLYLGGITLATAISSSSEFAAFPFFIYLSFIGVPSLISFGIDEISGSLYELSPEQIVVRLHKAEAGLLNDQNENNAMPLESDPNRPTESPK